MHALESIPSTPATGAIAAITSEASHASLCDRKPPFDIPVAYTHDRSMQPRSGNLVGVGYLLGHKHITTANHYVHARRRAAESVFSGHGVPGAHSRIVGVDELRRAARALVLRVADGDHVSIEALREFAALTLRCELVQLAHRLQDAPPEFAVRRAMELASLILTLEATEPASESASHGDPSV